MLGCGRHLASPCRARRTERDHRLTAGAGLASSQRTQVCSFVWSKTLALVPRAVTMTALAFPRPALGKARIRPAAPLQGERQEG